MRISHKLRSKLRRLMLHVKTKVNKIISVLIFRDSETSWLLRISIWCACYGVIWCACYGVFEKFSTVSLQLHVPCQMTYQADFSGISISYKYYEVSRNSQESARCLSSYVKWLKSRLVRIVTWCARCGVFAGVWGHDEVELSFDRVCRERHFVVADTCTCTLYSYIYIYIYVCMYI